MVKRVSLWDAGCPVARVLDVIGDWWSLLIIRDAFDGVRRFSEFQAGLGIAKGMLAARLRDLTERGILEMAPASDGSAYREYVLTEKGRGLFLVIVALRQWGEDHLYRPDEPKSSLVDTETGIPVAHLELRAQDGRPLDWTETQVKKTTDQGPTRQRKHAAGTRTDRRRG
ncbi:transcriptional regulator [Neorhizobium lilium]|uniref:Transcriptional regulator n=1 Tax=Neorhizobium lilium TaxID=2503024 RepID=A0A444LM71_9HYPH|nr:helix-turn-helix domain-containing protein [Neorhizobium lilium]RWX81414.1 transcriptional regulator [Neorhizobium lilium]